MSTAELKEKLIIEIKNTDDDELLMHISDLIEFESNSGTVHEMSREEIDAVNEGIAQLDNGQWITNEESNKRADEWLKKLGGL
jgi:predicted transcriptional regulator